MSMPTNDQIDPIMALARSFRSPQNKNASLGIFPHTQHSCPFRNPRRDLEPLPMSHHQHRRPPPTAVPAWTTVPDLTPQQLDDCRRLWDAQHKDESVEDSSPNDPLTDESTSKFKSKSKLQQSSTPLEPLTLKNIARIHHFFLTMLQTHTTLESTSSEGGRHEPGMSVRASCVAPYVHLFLPKKSDFHRTTPSTAPDTTSTTTSTSTNEIRLRTGVHVVTMH